MSKTVKQCPKCKQKFIYWWFEKVNGEDICGFCRPITFILDDGTRIIPQSDDEGNNGGALWFGTESEESVMPVLTGDD